MKLLLINKNPAISRLIGLSAYKLGYELVELFDFEESIEDSFDIAFVDSDIYEEEKLMGLKSLCKNVIYIGPRGTQKPLGVDGVLEKPFLPTDFITMVDNIEVDIQKGDDVFEDVVLDGDSETIAPTASVTQDFDEFEEFEDIEKSDLFEDLDDEPKWGEKGILDTQDIEEVKELLADEPSEGGIDLDDLSFLDDDNAQTLTNDEQKEDELDEGLDFATKSDELEDELHIDSILEDDELRLMDESKDDELHIDSLDDELKDDEPEDELHIESLLDTDELKEDELHIDSLLEDETELLDELKEDESKEDEQDSLDELHIDSLLEDEELKSADELHIDSLLEDEELKPIGEQDDDELDLSLEEVDEPSHDKSLEDELDLDVEIEADELALEEVDEPKEEEFALEELQRDEDMDELEDDELTQESEPEEESFGEEPANEQEEESSLDDEIEVSEDDLFQDEVVADEPKVEAPKSYTHSDDPFGGLSEDELKSAFGEVVESVKTAPNDNQKEELKLEIQKALVGALEQTKMKEALKNMKINISISFDE